MNEQLQKQLADMLAALTSVAQDAGKFAADQIPPLVHEKIVFGRVNETAQLLIVVAVCVWLYRSARSCKAHIGDTFDDGGWVAGLIASTVGAIIMLFASCYQLEQTLMVWFAPRLYIVEWLRGMVTK